MRQTGKTEKVVCRLADCTSAERGWRMGLTLTEVLVVIATLAFLLSILAPALGRAKDQAKVVACRSNLRSILVGCLLYAQQNDSVLPVDVTVDNPHRGLIDMLGSVGCAGTAASFYCPSQTQGELCFSEQNWQEGNIGYFYYSCAARPTNRNLSSFLLKSVVWPRIIRDTMPSGTWVISDCWFSGIPTAHEWYKKGVNYAVLDGSVHMAVESPRAEFK